LLIQKASIYFYKKPFFQRTWHFQLQSVQNAALITAWLCHFPPTKRYFPFPRFQRRQIYLPSNFRIPHELQCVRVPGPSENNYSISPCLLASKQSTQFSKQYFNLGMSLGVSIKISAIKRQARYKSPSSHPASFPSSSTPLHKDTKTGSYSIYGVPVLLSKRNPSKDACAVFQLCLHLP